MKRAGRGQEGENMFRDKYLAEDEDYMNTRCDTKGKRKNKTKTITYWYGTEEDETQNNADGNGGKDGNEACKIRERTGRR